MGKYRDKAYEKGQKDGAKHNTYKEPYGIIHAAIDKGAARVNKAYRDGHKNATNQRKK
jgi:hypothetical protein